MNESKQSHGESRHPTEGSIWFLRRLNLFEEMPSVASSLTGAALRDHRYRRGARIERGADVCVLKSGRIAIRWSRRRSGGVISSVLVPGQLFGFGDALGMGEAGIVTATTAAEVMCGSMGAFLAAIDLPAHPAEAFAVVLARHLYHLERRVELTHARRVPLRVAGILHELAEQNRRMTGVPIVTTRHSDIAAMAGTTRETVSRVIAFLKEEGVLVGRSVLRVNDLERLRALSGESEARRAG